MKPTPLPEPADVIEASDGTRIGLELGRKLVVAGARPLRTGYLVPQGPSCSTDTWAAFALQALGYVWPLQPHTGR